MKRVLCAALNIAMIVGLAGFFPSFAPTAHAATEGIYTYTVSDGKATVTDCDDSMSGGITIPSTLGGYPVTAIDDWAFSSLPGLTSVVIPDTVSTIGRYAFMGCYGLKSVTIPGSLASIGENVFSWCTGLTSVTISNGVTSIPSGMFYYCTSLTSLTLPRSVSFVSGYAFFGCESLTGIGVDSANAYFSSSDGILFDKSKTTLVVYPRGKGGTYTIPAGITAIGDYAFASCFELTTVTIPTSVTSIGNHAFSCCGRLASVAIPSSVTFIGDYAFWRCDALQSVVIPASVSSIGVNSFSENGLSSVVISAGIKSIGDYAFWYCRDLKSVVIPGSVSSIGAYAFASCNSLVSAVISEGVTSVGEKAFSGCGSLMTVSVPASVTHIGEDAFYASPSLSLCGLGGSYAHNYASRNDIPFVVTMVEKDLPVIILPGIMGSTTGASAYYPELTKELYTPAGKLTIADNYSWWVGDTGLVDLRKELEKSGVGVYECPYDWRLSLDEIYRHYLIPKIRQAKQETGKKRVILISHSMGGLVSRSYVQSDEYQYDVDSLYMLATPNNGSVKVVTLAEFAQPFEDFQKQTLSRLYQKMTGKSFSLESTKVLLDFFERKIPSIRALVPRGEELFFDVNKAYEVNGIQKGYFNETRNDFLDRLNDPEAIRKHYQPLDGGDGGKVKTVVFFSKDVTTPKALKVRASLSNDVIFPLRKGVGFDTVNGEKKGDGTVLSESASLNRSAPWTYVDGNFGEHTTMTNQLFSRIKKYLQSSFTRTIRMQQTQEHRRTPLSQEHPALSVTLIGDALASVENGSGSRTGSDFSGGVTEEIPHVRYSSGEGESSFRFETLAEDDYTLHIRNNGASVITASIDYSDADSMQSEAVSFFGRDDILHLRIQNGGVLLEAPAVRRLRAGAFSGKVRLMWDGVDGAGSYRIYTKEYRRDDYLLLATTTDTCFQTEDTWQEGFSDACIAYYVVPVIDGNEGYFNTCAYSFNTAEADFDYESDGGSVSFFDRSSGEITWWEWDFDSNGTVDSTEQNPVHTYTEDGVYSATLTVGGPSGTSVKTVSGVAKVGRYVTGVRISAAERFVGLGRQMQVSAVVQMSDGSDDADGSVVYVSSNERVATVDAGGVVSGVGVGTALISAVREQEVSSLEVEVTEAAVVLSGLVIHDGEKTVSVRVSNVLGDGFTATALLAVYDSHGLVGVRSVTDSFPKETGKSVEFHFEPPDDEPLTYKVLLWNTHEGLAPLGNQLGTYR